MDDSIIQGPQRESAISGQIGLFTSELLVLECRKNAIFNIVRSKAALVLIGFL